MNLSFRLITSCDCQSILIIQSILKQCGDDMYMKFGLEHWKNLYPIEIIRKNCDERQVYLIENTNTNEVFGTFQIKKNINSVELCKFGVVPEKAGNGIGNSVIHFIELFCKNNNFSKITLDVYDKSIHAINFYNHNGFKIVGTAETRRFQVLLMEKIVE